MRNKTRDKIKARDGYILTNGDIYGAEIYLAEGIDAADFHEITLEEYEAIREAQSTENVRAE